MVASAVAIGAVKSNARLAWVKVHRYAGLFIAFFLIIAGITGTTLAFYKELDAWLNPRLFKVVERAQPVLGPDALAARISAAYPDSYITLMTLDRRPGQSVRARIAANPGAKIEKTGSAAWTEIFLDPFDGQLLGGRERGVLHADRAHLMPFLYKLHYTLYIPGHWGEWLFGIAALVWVFDCFVGFYLTLPKSANGTANRSWWERWRPAWQIKRGASATRLNFDLHRANGLWFWAVLLVLAFTSVYFNLTAEVFRPVVSLFSPLAPEVAEVAPMLSQQPRPTRISYGQAIELARASLSPKARKMEPSYIGLTAGATGVYRVRFADVGRGDVNWHFRTELLYIDGEGGKTVLQRGHHLGSSGDKFLTWQYPMHSGQLFGLWGRVFIAAVGLVVTLLSITGIILWLKKLNHRQPRPARQATR